MSGREGRGGAGLRRARRVGVPPQPGPAPHGPWRACAARAPDAAAHGGGVTQSRTYGGGASSRRGGGGGAALCFYGGGAARPVRPGCPAVPVGRRPLLRRVLQGADSHPAHLFRPGLEAPHQFPLPLHRRLHDAQRTAAGERRGLEGGVATGTGGCLRSGCRPGGPPGWGRAAVSVLALSRRCGRGRGAPRLGDRCRAAVTPTPQTVRCAFDSASLAIGGANKTSALKSRTVVAGKTQK